MEGRSDYYVLRYAEKLLCSKESVHLLPGLGAGTFGSLAALSVGWNLNFIFMLDADKQGVIERDRYAREFGIPNSRLVSLDELVPDAKVIEDLLDQEATATIQALLGLPQFPKKPQIKRFFQERLASGKVEKLGDMFEENARRVLEGLSSRLKEGSGE